MNCCSLALVLVKKISEKVMKRVQKVKKARKKKGEVEKDGAESRSEDEKDSVLENIKEQLRALLSFKESLCTGKWNKSLAFILFLSC